MLIRVRKANATPRKSVNRVIDLIGEKLGKIIKRRAKLDDSLSFPHKMYARVYFIPLREILMSAISNIR